MTGSWVSSRRCVKSSRSCQYFWLFWMKSLTGWVHSCTQPGANIAQLRLCWLTFSKARHVLKPPPPIAKVENKRCFYFSSSWLIKKIHKSSWWWGFAETFFLSTKLIRILQKRGSYFPMIFDYIQTYAPKKTERFEFGFGFSIFWVFEFWVWVWVFYKFLANLE